MIVRSLFVALLAMLALPAFTQQNAALVSCPVTEKAVREVDHQIWAAYRSRDATALNNLVSDDLIRSNDEGMREDKQAVLAGRKSPEGDVHNETDEKINDFRVVFTNGVAILNFTRHETDSDKRVGVSWETTVRTTRVLTCTNGAWKMVVYHESVIPNVNRVPVSGSAAHFKDYVGRYRLGAKGELLITRVGEKIYETWAGEKAVELLPGKHETFFSREDGWVSSFIRNKAGKVSAILYTLPDGQFEAKRLP
jgi:ketosteroid isomerase-like protein